VLYVTAVFLARVSFITAMLVLESGMHRKISHVSFIAHRRSFSPSSTLLWT